MNCVPFASRHGGKSPLTTVEYGFCPSCGKAIQRKDKKFCNTQCFLDFEYKQYIEKWKRGAVDGTRGKDWKSISNHIRRYIFEKYDFKCAKCGWSEENPYTKTLPLEIEHIDGDSTNNKEENLILLCPNCHSLTKTYRGANRGKGTRNISWVPKSIC